MADNRAHALKQLKLKTVIKESHCSLVQHMDMNLCDADCRNLFATVAKDHVTIYDDMHMGDHVAVVGNLALSNTADEAKDVFHACCWISSAGLSRHPYGDALLAVGGSDSFIHIISIVQAAVVGQIPLPPGTAVAELCAAADCPGLLLVLCRDGTLQLWQISSGVCLWSCKTDAFAAALHPDGSHVLTSSRAGKLTQWDLTGINVSPAGSAAAAVHADVSKEAWLAAEHPDSAVDCVRFLTGDQVCVKTADGHMSAHGWPSGKLISSWKVPGCGSSSSPSYSKRCCFGHTKDGHYVCVGNHSAAAYMYDTRTGRQITRVEAIRVQGAVKACGLSEDCRHLLMVVGHGYLFRFEHRPALEKGSEDGEGSGSDTEMADAEGADGGQQQQEQQQQGSSLPQAQLQLPQQQQQQSAPSPGAASTPAAATGAAQQQEDDPQQDSQQQQQQQRQYTPSTFDGLPQGLDGAKLVASNSTGSLDALMGCDGTPQGEGLEEVTAHQQAVPGLSGSLGGLQHKQQRLSGMDTDDSPLVFRPTPQKQ